MGSGEGDGAWPPGEEDGRGRRRPLVSGAAGAWAMWSTSGLSLLLGYDDTTRDGLIFFTAIRGGGLMLGWEAR